MDTPFELLLDLDRRARCFAEEVPSSEEVKRLWRGVGFVLKGERYVSPLEDIQEVLRPPESLTPIPGVVPWVLGVANVRGRLLPVIDLGCFLGFGVAQSIRQQVLVIEHGDMFCGLLVDEVTGMQHFREESYQGSVPVQVSDKVKPFLAGSYWLNDSDEYLLFSLKALVESADFLQVSMGHEVATA
ncbi:chemotaxis protein CheW [Sansalvadorimonas sp. 2012CJ34-2]|uniref:Chemotaxis protein CheW n=1 Tax=Parendozoicomonas callyspongiae TaxID=2942213 RepID=A0ABT0PAZ8_9GAMM|nr:chemotaxis protein CheW [Sansalvadorimonas sp. 2012CJ34-2]MCL6268448.1 chemotaxis protein CheW [Sansalvadorimonas sp. 2012CJ34-2]